MPARSICFEITEQVAVQHLEEASLLMRSLQKIGCEFALDDFGAGYSSLNYIKTLPIDYIKIDGGFISNMHQDPIDQAMVQREDHRHCLSVGAPPWLPASRCLQ